MGRLTFDSFKKSIRDAGYTREEESAIWDFYVTKSLSKAASQNRNLEDYRQPVFGAPRIRLEHLLTRADVDTESVLIIRGNNMDRGLEKLGLKTEENISKSLDLPRIAFINTLPGHMDSSKSSIISLMSHVRNALAHGHTYFFPNGFVLLEDVNLQRVITARILYHKNTLLNWIFYFDQDGIYYPEIHLNKEPRKPGFIKD